MGQNNEIESRYISMPIQSAEIRADENSENGERFIEGYAALFNQRTLIGSPKYGFYESIKEGAFSDVMGDDVRCLINHNQNYIIGRTKSKTLEISVDEKGLKFRCKLPKRSYADDLADAISSGDVDGCSFSFQVKSQEWRWATKEGEIDERVITKFSKLLDVAPVTYPAYQGTSVSKRSMADYDEAKKVHEAETRQKGNSALSLQRAKYMFNKNQSSK